MSCLIEVIDEENECRRISVRSLFPDLIVAPISQAELVNQYTQFKAMSTKEKQHTIQKLLIYCLRSSQERTDGVSLFIEPIESKSPSTMALQLIGEDVSWINWKSKCLSLLLCPVIYRNSELRKSLLQQLQQVIYTEVIFDMHEEVHICLYQLMEIIDKDDTSFQSTCTDWIDCLISIENATSSYCLSWIKRIRNSRPSSSQHHIEEHISRCIETPSNSLHYNSIIHTSLYILHGVSFAI